MSPTETPMRCATCGRSVTGPGTRDPFGRVFCCPAHRPWTTLLSVQPLRQAGPPNPMTPRKDQTMTIRDLVTDGPERDTLEQIVDRYSLANVVEALVAICG